MTNILKFDSTVYSEELFAGISEDEYNEVMQASAVAGGGQGYTEWSAELKQGQIVDTPHGQILINRDCSHKDCLTTRCEKGATYQGIAI
jgi:hypothetical protein